ncbi:MAG: hypothetical protein KJ550_12910 [Proteobacteria bacterium]|nr:hypothetical protein [Desulfobacteraceae bacterium]MBU2521901.1 hypothetical protein [Pseudomonadota bacterium]MBU3980156.1 hypothetical protein [Pseudomonadota bacterium]MBU4014345.1 hypothetical protein [Pseudomonadota bacterium]MBU4067833.1 hypothetical protein [Pseudomonadota bacterium]
MGFIRRQEIQLAIKFLVWQYQKSNIQAPEHSALEQQAGKIVDEAHRIARERGSNILSIIKELAADIKKT